MARGMKRKPAVTQLECAVTAAAAFVNCGQCIACDAAEELRAVAMRLRKVAEGVDGTGTEAQILREVKAIEARVGSDHVCPYCRQPRVGKRDECGGVDDGICAERAAAEDKAEGRS